MGMESATLISSEPVRVVRMDFQSWTGPSFSEEALVVQNFTSADNSCEYDRTLYETWTHSSLWTDRELVEYGCEYWSFKQFQRAVDYFKWLVYLVGGLVGISSAVLALWTFSHREFEAISFMYHRVINGIELAFMGLMLERATRDYTSPAFLYSPSWATYVAKISGKIDNTLPTWVNIITLFLSVERAVACLAPSHFAILNRPGVVWSVVGAAFLVSSSIWAPSSFAHTTMYDNRTDPVRYMPVWSEWAKGNGYACYHTIRHSLTLLGAVLMVVASIMALVGLRRAAGRGIRRSGPSDYWYLLRQLSYLQLCETVPMIVLHVLLVVADSIHWDYKGGGAMAPWDVSFQDALRTLTIARTKQTIVVCLDVSNVAAHCFHFYWYLLFCPKVRRGFFNCVRGYGRPTVTGANATTRVGPRTSIGSLDGHQTLDPQSIILRQSFLSVNGSPKAQKTKKCTSSNGFLGVSLL